MRRSKVIVIGMVTTGLAVAFWMWLLIIDGEQRDRQQVFQLHARLWADAVEEELGDHNLTALQSVAGLVHSMGSIDLAEFRTFARSVLTSATALRAIEWVPCVPEAARGAFEEAPGGSAIRQRSPAGSQVRATGRTAYFPVALVEPLAGNEATLGFDLGSEPPCLEALAVARDSGRPAASHAIALIQDPAGSPGVLVCVPVYAGSGTPASGAERQARLRGYVLGVLVPQRLLERAQRLLQTGLLQVRLADSGDGADGKTLGILGDVPSPADSAAHPDLVQRIPITLADRRWTLTIRATDAFAAAQASYLHLSVPAIIVLLTAAAAGIWWWQGRSRRQLEAEVAQRTALLRTLIDSIPDAVFVKDVHGVFMSCNPAFAALIGRPEGGIVGKRDEDLLPAAMAAADRAEDQAVISTGTTSSSELWFTLPDGSRRLMEKLKRPLRSGDGRMLGVLGLSRDITAIRQTAERLERVFDAVDDGFWDLDVPTSRVFFSRRWKEMLGYADHEIGDRLDEWSSRVHPDDLPGVMIEVGRHMRGETTIYQTEHRMLRKDGAWMWILDRGRVVQHDADGKPLRVVGTHTDITARKQAEEALAASRQLEQQLIAASPLGITVFDGASGDCLQANDAAGRIVGAAAEQVLAQNFRRIPSWRESGLTASAEATLLDGQPRSGEVLVDLRSDHDLWLRHHFTRIAGGGQPRLLLMSEDVTLRKRLEQAQADLQLDLGQRIAERTLDLVLANQALAARDHSLRIFQTVIEQNPVAIFISDSQRQITYANPAFYAQTGWQSRDVIAADPLRFVVRTGSAGNADDLAGALVAGREWTGELLYQHQDGHTFWIDAVIAPLTDHDNARLGFVGFHRDISGIKLAQAEARQRTEELIQADKMAALGILVAGVGHEINNPANFISLNEPLLRGFWDAAVPVLDQHAATDATFALNNLPWPRARALVPRLFTGIAEGIARIRHIVGDLRDFARPDRGDYQPIDLNQVIKATTAITAHAIDKSTQCFACELAPDLPLVMGSFQRLEQVLVNLVLNACQALTAGDQELTLRSGWDAARNRVVVSVIDGGSGMSAEVLRHLGEPFFTTKRERGGTGLGLSVSRRIVTDHGGELHFVSEPGKGTTATLFLLPQRSRTSIEMAARPPGKDEPCAEPAS